MNLTGYYFQQPLYVNNFELPFLLRLSFPIAFTVVVQLNDTHKIMYMYVREPLNYSVHDACYKNFIKIIELCL